MDLPLAPVPLRASIEAKPDHRESWIPSGAMIADQGSWSCESAAASMITMALVTVGFPTVFLVIRLLLHAIAPKTYGPAGGYSIYTALVSGVPYVFGFIVADPGRHGGSADLAEGMFRHLVVTGRSRLALYLGSDSCRTRDYCARWRWASPSSAPCACSPRRRRDFLSTVSTYPPTCHAAGWRVGPLIMRTRSSATSASGLDRLHRPLP